MNSMNDSPTQAPLPPEEDPIEVNPDESSNDTTTSTEETTPPQSQEELLTLEVSKWKDQAIRTAAELDNYRKRVSRDLQDARKYGNRGLLEELLPVIDNFTMGLNAASEDQSSMIFLGMKMVKDQLNEFLTNNGVKTLSPATGEVFNHNFHEAISQEETNEHEDGTIIKVARTGYILNDKLLRPANVIVATQPNDAEETTANQNDQKS